MSVDKPKEPVKEPEPVKYEPGPVTKQTEELIKNEMPVPAKEPEPEEKPVEVPVAPEPEPVKEPAQRPVTIMKKKGGRRNKA